MPRPAPGGSERRKTRQGARDLLQHRANGSATESGTASTTPCPPVADVIRSCRCTHCGCPAPPGKGDRTGNGSPVPLSGYRRELAAPREDRVTWRRCTPLRRSTRSDSVHSGQVGTARRGWARRRPLPGTRPTVCRSAAAVRGTPRGCLPSPRTTAVDFHSGTGERKARNTGRAPSDKTVPSSRNSSSAAPPTRTNRIWVIRPGQSAGYAPPATRARACARRGPLHGTREWIARVPVKRSDRGTHRLSRRSCA